MTVCKHPILCKAVVVTHPPRKTRFRLLVRLYRTGLVTRRVPSERYQASDYPPFPSFLARCRFVFSRGKSGGGNPGRVDLGGCPPRSPTDPGLHITRTRFLTYDFAALRNRLWTTRGLGKPYRCSSRRKSDQGISPSRRRRESQCRQIFLASSRNSWRLGKLPVIP